MRVLDHVRRRLGIRLTILFLALSLVPLILVGFLAYRNSRQTVEAQQFDHLNAISMLKADEINRWVGDNEQTLASLAQRPLVREYAATLVQAEPETALVGDTPAALLENHLLPGLAEDGGFRELFLLDAGDGEIIVSTNRAAEGKYRESEPYYLQGRQRTYTQNVYYSLVRDAPLMTIGTPIRDSAGDVVAVLAGHVDLSELTEIAEQTSELTASEDTYLVNDFNFFVTDPRFGAGFALQEAVHSEGIERCLQGESGTGVYEDYRGALVLGAFRWLPVRELCIVTEIDQAEAFQPIRALRDSVVSVASLVILGVVIAGILFTRSLTTPLRRLLRGTERIGHGDLDYQIEVETGDEIGQLTAAFNQMTRNLRENEARFRHLANAMPQIVWTARPDGTMDYFNEQRQVLYGVEEQGERWRWLDVVHPEDRERTVEAWQAALAAASPYQMEHRVRHRDGNYYWYLTRAVPIRDEQGDLTKWYGTSTNIQSQKEVEVELHRYREELEELVAERTAALQKSESRFRVLFSAVPVPVVVTDAASGEILEANRHVAATLRLPPEQVVGRNVRDLYADASQRGPRIQQILEERHVQGHELTVTRGDGEEASLLLSTSTIEYEGRPALLSSLVDLTERKEMETALRRSEERFRALFQNASDVITVLDGQGRIQYDSPSIQRVLGYGPEERVGTPVFTYVAPGEIPSTQAAFARLSSEPEATVSLDVEVRHRDGSWRTLEVTASNLLADPAVRGIVVNAHDVTARKHLEDDLRRERDRLARSNEELEQFAYVASHDLQEPLRMVSSFLQLLQRRYGEQLDETADEYIYYAVDGATRMKVLINDLLQYSRVATKGNPPAPTASQEVLDKVLGDLQFVVEEKEATITAEPLPLVLADETQFGQLLQNLIGNALKFHGDEPPRIHVSAERQNGMWQFAVSDNGIGIESQHAERIFVIFQRLHGGGQYEGTGIGLAICQKIVERHGGRIWLASEPGAGTTFYFTLPAVPQNEMNDNGRETP